MGYIWIPALVLLSAIYPVPVVNGDYAIGPDVYFMDYSTWVTEPGRVVLAAHTPGAFQDIDTLVLGDVIVIESKGGIVRYRVTWRWITAPDEWQWPPPNGNDLILVTCYDGDAKRLLVGAERIE